jgi:hypothetical protein
MNRRSCGAVQPFEGECPFDPDGAWPFVGETLWADDSACGCGAVARSSPGGRAEGVGVGVGVEGVGGAVGCGSGADARSDIWARSGTGGGDAAAPLPPGAAVVPVDVRGPSWRGRPWRGRP